MEHNISLKSTVNFLSNLRRSSFIIRHWGNRTRLHKPIARVTLFDQVSSLRS